VDIEEGKAEAVLDLVEEVEYALPTRKVTAIVATLAAFRMRVEEEAEEAAVEVYAMTFKKVTVPVVTLAAFRMRLVEVEEEGVEAEERALPTRKVNAPEVTPAVFRTRVGEEEEEVGVEIYASLTRRATVTRGTPAAFPTRVVEEEEVVVGGHATISGKVGVAEEITVGFPMTKTLVLRVLMRESVMHTLEDNALEEIPVGFLMRKKKVVVVREDFRQLLVELKLASTF